ncbi:MAG: APC family permease [Acidobacteriia bacterium]|nr:APC family permease [Terriglobia bacterium]
MAHPVAASTSTATKSALRKAGLFYFVWVMFSYCTGGPFGLEDMVTTSGPGMTLIYLLVLPLFWCIPVSLVSAELTTAMPVEGGFYRWARAGFGDFWGFLAGWWNWCASFLLGAAYAVQFSDYLGFYIPQLTGWKHYIVSLAIVAIITWINVRGIQAVGKFATALEIFILLPVLVLSVIGLAHWKHNPFVPLVPPHQPPFSVFGVGLALGLWLYSGYEQLSTVAEEVENPQRSYPLALAIVVPMSIAVYFLPTLASLAALGNWQSWHTRYFSDAAQLVGGPWLGVWMTLAAMVTNIALLNGTILASTRMPFAMAEDGYLPHALTQKHPRYGTPWIAIIASAVVYGLLARQNLLQIIVVYNWLRIATTVLTVLSAWKLRRKHPDMNRPFVIPWRRKGLYYAVAAPLIMSAVALLGSDRYGLIWGPVALAAGPAAYWVIRQKIKI